MKRKGATTVEFAFVAPILFLFIFIFCEIGIILSMQQTLTNASREGARAASLIPSSMASAHAAIDHKINNSLVKNVTRDITPDPSTASSGDIIRVTLTTTETPITYVAKEWFGTDFQLSSTSTMRKE